MGNAIIERIGVDSLFLISITNNDLSFYDLKVRLSIISQYHCEARRHMLTYSMAYSKGLAGI